MLIHINIPATKRLLKMSLCYGKYSEAEAQLSDEMGSGLAGQLSFEGTRLLTAGLCPFVPAIP